MSGTARHFKAMRRLVISDEIPEDAPARVKEGLARRRIVAMTGRCPCGATVPDVALERGKLTVAVVRHEAGCPAVLR